MDNTAFAFDQPFAEAVDAFLARKIMSKAEFDKLAATEKAKAFTVARVYVADDLQKIFDLLGETLQKGGTYQEFSQVAESIITNAWHRETVFRTNQLSSYGSGHWQQAQATKAARPYVIYRDMGDGRVRPDHRLGGLVLRLDDPFVQSHWCPWAYN